MNKNEFILTLLNIPRVGLVTAHKLYGFYNDKLEVESIIEIVNSCLKKSVTKDDVYRSNEHAKEVLTECKNTDINVVNIDDDDFPEKFKDLKKIPLILFYKGDIKKLNLYPSVAVIGTRTPSDYAVEVTKKYVEYLTKMNINIVSGLARGIDRVSHEIALNNGGYTAAFIGQGLNTPIYPSENQEIALKIIENSGALISEYEPTVKPHLSYFVERDRLQSGASDGIILMESQIAGGSMHAVNETLNLKRTVAAFNHPIKFRLNNLNVEGNQTLINHNKALSIFSKDDLNSFCLKIKKHHKLYKNSTSGTSVDNQQMNTQVSFIEDDLL